MYLNSGLNGSGVNNFNYLVSVHYSFIYSCIHCFYLIITLLLINGHEEIELIPVCNGQMPKRKRHSEGPCDTLF